MAYNCKFAIKHEKFGKNADIFILAKVANYTNSNIIMAFVLQFLSLGVLFVFFAHSYDHLEKYCRRFWHFWNNFTLGLVPLGIFIYLSHNFWLPFLKRMLTGFENWLFIKSDNLENVSCPVGSYLFTLLIIFYYAEKNGRWYWRLVIDEIRQFRNCS